MNDFEKRWQRIQEQLGLELNGDERPMVSSGRTLFGIKSSVEEKMDAVAAEMEAEAKMRRAANRHAQTQGKDRQ